MDLHFHSFSPSSVLTNTRQLATKDNFSKKEYAQVFIIEFLLILEKYLIMWRKVYDNTVTWGKKTNSKQCVQHDPDFSVKLEKGIRS